MKNKPFAWASLLCLLLGACDSHKIDPRVAGIEELPAFNIMSTDSVTVIHTAQLPGDHAYVFMYFSPDCEHCQRVTQQLVDHRKELDQANVRVFMITNEPARDAAAFVRYYHLNTLTTFFIGTDCNYAFASAFSPTSTPYIAVYNRERKLRMVSKGEADVQEILKSLTD